MLTLIDTKRKLIELALDEGRRRESPRTGLIHFCYDREEETDTIPYYENLCFCLALFRSCIGDHIQEGKERLSHLLAYHTFPTYLHEFPKNGPTQRLYFPLYWIDKLFSSVIESSLRLKIKKVIGQIKPFNKPLIISSSIDAASLCLYLQLEERPLAPLLPYWDKEKHIYAGPLLDERQRKNKPDTTLFDFFMSAATGTFSNRILSPHPIHMHASLVFPTEPINQPYPLSTQINCVPKNMHSYKGFHLFRLLWKGEDDHLHTLVCQDKALSYKDGIFTYPEEIPDEKNRLELSFFCDYHEDVTILVNSEKSTVFQMEDLVTIHTKNKIVQLKFNIENGEGTLMGHISRGNRPSQIIKDKYCAYDWKIGIRSIDRTPKFKLKLSLLEE